MYFLHAKSKMTELKKFKSGGNLSPKLFLILNLLYLAVLKYSNAQSHRKQTRNVLLLIFFILLLFLLKKQRKTFQVYGYAAAYIIHEC